MADHLKKPSMILFDYGQTLAAEARFDGVKGTEAVLQYAKKNKYGLTAAQIQEKANELNRELGRFDPQKRHACQIEIPNVMFTPYLYESLGVEIALTNEQLDTVFWDAAAPAVPTEGIRELLNYVKEKGIRTAVISNIVYSPAAVRRRIGELIPEHSFEFILASSNYLFRKPNRRIFELALEKADLKAEEVWYIGDQYECDIKGAQGAGLFPVWYIGAIDLPYTEDRSVLTVSSWEQLRRMMEESF